MIKAVLFDYGGVLTQGGTSGGVIRLIANALNVPEKDVLPARELMSELLLGKVTTARFLQKLRQAYPYAQKPNSTKLLANAEVFVPSQPVYELAAQLRASGVRTGILSNMFELAAARLRQKGLYDGFDPVVLSCEEHLAKPDPLFYDCAIQKLGLRPEEVIFIDDQERFRPPADFVGMHFVLAQSPEQIVADVKSLLFEYDGLRLD
ncbi:MAG TPA: HAD family phosphatase [Candidatus Saccharimonadales bacterium]|nr:HAD family phosphatase [Candidatus Saccharimonadales bacterium]